MERGLTWKGTNDGGIQLSVPTHRQDCNDINRADVLLSFFSRTGRLCFSNTSSSVLLFLSPPQLKLPSTFPSLRPLLCLSLPPLWCFVSYFSYSEFRIRLHSTSHLSAHPFRYFQANILHFGNARLAFINVPNVLTITVCIYLSEYADGRSSNVGLRQQRLPTFTRESSADIQSLPLVPLGETGTSLWFELYTLP